MLWPAFAADLYSARSEVTAVRSSFAVNAVQSFENSVLQQDQEKCKDRAEDYRTPSAGGAARWPKYEEVHKCGWPKEKANQMGNIKGGAEQSAAMNSAERNQQY
jgi:hypothetical protein